jgi:hypothetical protein
MIIGSCQGGSVTRRVEARSWSCAIATLTPTRAAAGKSNRPLSTVARTRMACAPLHGSTTTAQTKSQLFCTCRSFSDPHRPEEHDTLPGRFPGNTERWRFEELAGTNLRTQKEREVSFTSPEAAEQTLFCPTSDQRPNRTCQAEKPKTTESFAIGQSCEPEKNPKRCKP